MRPTGYSVRMPATRAEFADGKPGSFRVSEGSWVG